MLCRFEPLESTKTIGDLAREVYCYTEMNILMKQMNFSNDHTQKSCPITQLVKRFMLDLDAVNDLQLSSGGFTLPHTGRLSLLRDGDIVSITALIKAADPTNAVSKH